MNRRDLITLVGGAAVWPVAARAQQVAMPVIVLVSARSPDDDARYGSAFRMGLAATGFIAGRTVTVEYHWLDGQYGDLPALMDDLVRRRVAVIGTPGSATAALAAKASTKTIPIVFGVGDDPVKLGLVESLARPAGNVTGYNNFGNEVVGKRLAFLHELVPNAVRVAVLVNPTNATSTAQRDVPEVARALGLQIQVLNASTGPEIEAAFATLVRQRADALFVAPDAFFSSQRAQLAALSARYAIPMTRSNPEDIEMIGGLMSYGTDFVDVYRQVGVYIGRVLNGENPADMPVEQSTKFALVINLKTARTLGITVPPNLLAVADEVIE